MWWVGALLTAPAAERPGALDLVEDPVAANEREEDCGVRMVEAETRQYLLGTK